MHPPPLKVASVILCGRGFSAGACASAQRGIRWRNRPSLRPNSTGARSRAVPGKSSRNAKIGPSCRLRAEPKDERPLRRPVLYPLHPLSLLLLLPLLLLLKKRPPL